MITIVTTITTTPTGGVDVLTRGVGESATPLEARAADALMEAIRRHHEADSVNYQSTTLLVHDPHNRLKS